MRIKSNLRRQFILLPIVLILIVLLTLVPTHADEQWVRFNGDSAEQVGLGHVSGGWQSDDDIGVRVYLINPDGTPYSKHPEVYDFIYADSPNIDVVKTAFDAGGTHNNPGPTYYSAWSSTETQMYILSLQMMPQKIRRPNSIRTCGGSSGCLVNLPKWREAQAEGINNWAYEISSNGKDQNLVWEILMKLYDIGPSIPFDTAAYNDWKNGDLEVVMENTVFYVQNCSGNELLLKQCTSRTLSSQEIDAVSTGMVTLEQLGVESQYYPIQLYGTASDVAKWCLNHSRELGNRTGGYVQDLVQHNLPTGLMLFKQEEDNVWTRPAQRTGRIPLDIIGHPVNGYGTITWRKLDGKRDEDLDEQWVTNDPSKIGITIVPPGDSPGKAPDMPEDSDGVARKVKIIKIYADKIKNGTDIRYEAKGTFVTEKVTDRIAIQDEPEYRLQTWWESQSSTEYTLYRTNPGTTPAQRDRAKQGGQKGNSETTININTEKYTTLYVYLERTIEEEEPDKVEMILNESEITHKYQTTDITEFQTQNTELKFEWAAYGGECPEKIPVPKDCGDENCGKDKKVDLATGEVSYTGQRHCTCTSIEPCGGKYKANDGSYEIHLQDSTNYGANQFILTNKLPFKSDIEKYYSYLSGNEGTADVDEGSTTVRGYKLDFVIWRGDDKPIQCGYWPTDHNIDQENLIETANEITSAPPTNSRRILGRNGSEEMPKEYNVKIEAKMDKGMSTYELEQVCSKDSSHGGKHQEVVQADPDINLIGKAKVYSYIDFESNTNKKGDVAKNNAQLDNGLGKYPGGSGDTNHQWVSTVTRFLDDPITFYPHVRMTYQLPDATSPEDRTPVHAMVYLGFASGVQSLVKTGQYISKSPYRHRGIFYVEHEV